MPPQAQAPVLDPAPPPLAPPPVPARKNATEKLSRGTVYANLSVERKGVLPTVKVN